MKIQCDVCEKAEAAVLCCADEAALCWSCDEKVHAANKLAEKHQRVLLVPHRSHNQNQSHPSCDICQEKAGYFFCLEDRALLCRQCDVSIHSSTPYVSSHQRFLLTGVKLDVDDLQNQHSSINSSSNTSSIHVNSPNPNNNTTTNSNNNYYKRSWDTFSSETNFEIQPHWPSDEVVMTNTTINNSNASTRDFDDCYEFSPSDFGCSSISSK